MGRAIGGAVMGRDRADRSNFNSTMRDLTLKREAPKSAFILIILYCLTKISFSGNMIELNIMLNVWNYAAYIFYTGSA